MTERSVWVLATCDTKGVEAFWVAERLRAAGVATKLLDASCSGASPVPVDVLRERVFDASGTSFDAASAGDRGEAVDAAARGAAKLVRDAFERGELAGVFGLGGSAGTTIGTAAMRELPIGVPKLMVSTLASGPVRNFVRDKDVLMLNSVVDVAGINRISRLVLANGADAMAGMATATPPPADFAERPLVAATMFGVTTPCVEHARALLEAEGYEVIVFHATGNGGQALESLVREGYFVGVLDLTTTELADELVGGVLSAGPDRLTACAECGVPQVVSVGALDMVNFQERDSVPIRFEGRRFHEHNANVTLMRTTVEENRALGQELGAKVALSAGSASILLPAKGVSAIDRTGELFDDAAARRALFEAIRGNAGAVPCSEIPFHLNDPEFAAAAVKELLTLILSPI